MFQDSVARTKIKGVGVDIASISRIAQLIKNYDRETLTTVFTAGELDYCSSASDLELAYTLCFAIKESVGKALATGLVDIDWHEIEAELNNDRPKICLHGKAHVREQKLGIKKWLVNWWEWECYVLVHVLAV
ncbi:MAG: 4'-phosphopantetheinyl transferase superfamily protein [Pleurocapsa sp. CRU_1_2]|nr:4'-phosphopantetheinyl transferase superfamily protein [Pleurocapsa sp. CRU_1_2]